MRPFCDNSRKSALKLLALALLLVACGCRNRSTTTVMVAGGTGPAGEPEQYSATVEQTVEYGDERKVSMTRTARLGELIRHEWTEEGEVRAIIWRPDLGKSYLLYTDRQVYVESDTTAADQSDREQTHGSGAAASISLGLEEIERAFGDSAQPTQAKESALPDQTIGGYVCKATEQRITFDDGHTEVTRYFRASELGGLALRVEIETEADGKRLKVVTERRDIRTEVAPDEFNIPAGYRKAEKGSLR